MAGEKKRTGIAIGLGLLAGAGIALAISAGGAPPGEWNCPYCPATFDTYEELVAHVEQEHPGERIPLPIEWE